ncbi:MAG: serine/threonine protein kinase [Candidatus Bathyarchaeia archaeon]
MIVPLDEIASDKYGLILCYPRYNPDEAGRRIIEIRELGVVAICFGGDKIVAGLPVLGKGCVGIVVQALLNDGRRVALKIRRVDSEPERIVHEARMLQMANSVDVGPMLLGYTSNFLIMEYIEGLLFPRWVEMLGDGESVSMRLRVVLRDILEQCWRLDSIGLDHGELSWADKHIIIDGRDGAHILDFETASDKRRVANVTSVSQYLFIKSGVAKIIGERIGCLDKGVLLESLRAYKIERSRKNFETILDVLGLMG